MLSKGCAEMIHKVYEVDPLYYPTGSGRMRVIAFIEELKTIDKIIRHLKLRFQAERPPPPQVVQQELLMAFEERENISERLCGCFLMIRGRVYLKLDGLELLVVCCSFLAVDLVVLGVILFFENASGWKLRKMVKDLAQVQKGNSHIYFSQSLKFFEFNLQKCNIWG